MRFKILFQTIVSNTLSYIFQAASFMASTTKSDFFHLLLTISEAFYTYSFSHYYAHQNKMEDIRRNTYYLKDGYGRRYKISRKPHSFYDPMNFRPALLIRHRK